MKKEPVTLEQLEHVYAKTTQILQKTTELHNSKEYMPKVRWAAAWFEILCEKLWQAQFSDAETFNKKHPRFWLLLEVDRLTAVHVYHYAMLYARCRNEHLQFRGSAVAETMLEDWWNDDIKDSVRGD